LRSAKTNSRAKPETRAGEEIGEGPGKPLPRICFCKIDYGKMQPGAYFTSKLPDLAIVKMFKMPALTATRIQWAV